MTVAERTTESDVRRRMEQIIARRNTAMTDCDTAIEAAREIQGALAEAVELLEDLLREDAEDV